MTKTVSKSFVFIMWIIDRYQLHKLLAKNNLKKKYIYLTFFFLGTILEFLHSAWKIFTFLSTYFKRENLEETCIISFYFYGYTFFKLERTVFKTVKKGFLLFWPDSIQRGTYWIFFSEFQFRFLKKKVKTESAVIIVGFRKIQRIPIAV